LNVRRAPVLAFIALAASVAVAEETGAKGDASWLAAHPVVRVGLELDYPPFSFVDAAGQPAGVSVEYLRLVEQALGVRFEVTARASLPALLELARHGEIDLLGSLTRTPDREGYLHFTRPYFTSPLVLVVRSERTDRDRLEELAGARIAVWRGSAGEEFLRRSFPRVEPVPVANDDATVLLVLSGNVDGAVADLASVSSILTSTGIHGLRVAARAGLSYDHAFAARADAPELARLVDDALRAVPPEEARRIRDRFMPIEVGPGPPDPHRWDWVAFAAVAAVLLSLVFLGVNRALRAQVARRTRELEASEKRYRLLADHARDVIWTFDLRTGRFTYVSPAIVHLRGYTPEEAMAEPLDRSLTPESFRRVQEALARLGTGDDAGPRTAVFDQPCKDGSVKHVEITTQLVREGGVPAQVVGVSRDVTARVRAEQADAEREGYLRSILDTAQDGFWAVDLTGRIVDVNPAACAMVGYSRAEMIGMRLPDIDRSESPAALAEHIERVRARGHDRFEAFHQRKDGSLIRVDIAVTLIGLRGGLMVCFLHDVTGRRQAAEALERSRRTLLVLTRCREAILRAADEQELFQGVCQAIVETGGYRMCWVGVAENDARRTVRPVAHAGHEDGYLEAVDITWSEEPSGQGPTGLSLREERVVVGQDFATDQRLAPWRDEALRRGYRSSSSLPLVHGQEKIGVLVMYSGDVFTFGDEELRLLGQLADDVAFGAHALRQRAARARADADREHALRALQDEKDRFKALIEQSSDLTLVISPEGIITFASPASTTVLGIPPSEMVGRAAFDFVHPDDLARRETSLATVLRDPSIVQQLELRVRRADGTWALVETRRRNLVHVPGIGGVVVNSRDITERQRIREQLQQAQKLESIGRLAGGVAHDFNNLLTIILGCATDLRKRLAREGHPATEYADDVIEAGKRGADLTRRLLAFARKQVVEPLVLDLNERIGAETRLLSRLLGEDVSIREELQPGLWPVRCDPGLFTQVIMNLAANSRDAMPAGGSFTLATANVGIAPGEPVPDPEMTPGSYVRLTVSDSGTGMTPDVLAHVFEPFFTTKAPGVGTGLGLATVYGIVKQSGGFMGVSSTPGKGTTFEIFFPRHDLAEDGFPRSAGSDAQPGSETVLVVEDDPGVRALVVRALREAGYRVLPASGGDEAEFIARELDGPLDLLLTDVVMPGRTGPEVARAITAIRPGVPVLFVSGYTHDAIGRKGELPEGTDLLQKPFTPEALLARVRSVLDRRGIPAA
jgi:PAS domain S-box-containing protein